ncbi:McrB family protein [Maribacter sp. MAR_2009_72]|uniref:McrB family protein n=1 Tax=Maribacter sp. MAR_2009_72 TaxID=1250050 RepID=UPI00119A2149|nr:AAA family ATPase [Maribacter sp. MAR_2009_72]TVZ16402.1 dynein-related subfamily AAA family protein [Maribacter sp. MAR_2009_72]
MDWLKLINNEAFKEWLINTGSSSTLPQGDFRLDPFGSSLRKFNNAHSWLEVLSNTGVFTPSGRKSQAISDLTSAELLKSDESFTDFGKLVYDKWEKYSIPAGNADYEIHRCLLLISASFNKSNSVYKDYYSRWLELRKIFSFNFLINNKVYLYLFSYLDKDAVGFNPVKFVKSLNLTEKNFTSTIDWESIKTYYSDASVDTAVNKYESTISGYLTREGRSNICIAMELFNSNKSEREAVIAEIGIASPELDVLNNILADIKVSISASQKIYYGAPGTGKSHKIKEILKGKESRTERVTFHPEYDYASFIGGFKPITEKDAVSGLDEIKYKFVPQIFTNIYIDAWQNEFQDYFLVIEEINRGNCAEIFGDIFQLLDEGYEITPSFELANHLEKMLTKKGYDGFTNGKMQLPSNLSLLATMNTSDQSLFPMDSAFKRRWDWEYIPIDYNKLPENPSSNFKVTLSDTESFYWIDFIKKVNSIIKQNPNLGMDKCIGNYFIKAKDDTISLEEFINKAIFYLWNDVFKDEDDHIFEENTFYEDFFPIPEKGKEKVEKILKKIGLIEPEKED